MKENKSEIKKLILWLFILFLVILMSISINFFNKRDTNTIANTTTREEITDKITEEEQQEVQDEIDNWLKENNK